MTVPISDYEHIHIGTDRCEYSIQIINILICNIMDLSIIVIWYQNISQISLTDRIGLTDRISLTD